MSLFLQLARTAIIVLLGVGVASCTFVSRVYEVDFDMDRATGKIGNAYKARDNCLKWATVGIDDGQTDLAELGARVARFCNAETGALIRATDPHGDPAIAASTEADSVFRATGYVIKMRSIAVDITNERANAQKR